MLRSKQGDSIVLTAGSPTITDYLKSLNKNTEIHSIILNFLVSNGTGAAIELKTVLDKIFIKLKRDGSLTTHDCTAMDLVMIQMMKHKANANLMSTTIAATTGTRNVQVVIPFADKSLENPKDTVMVVNTLKSLQLEMLWEGITDVTVGTVETQIIFENEGVSTRIPSVRKIIRSGISLGTLGKKVAANYNEALRTLAFIISDATNFAYIDYLQVDGDKETIGYGETDELNAVANDVLQMSAFDTIINSTQKIADVAIVLPFVSRFGSYSESVYQALKLRFDISHSYSGNLVEDFIETPSVRDITNTKNMVYPNTPRNALYVRAIDKSSASMSSDKAGKSSLISQMKIGPKDTASTPLTPNTATLNLEAKIGMLSEN